MGTEPFKMKRGFWKPPSHFLEAINILKDILSYKYEFILVKKKDPIEGRMTSPES